MVRQFDPKQVSITLGGKIITGFQDGSFIIVRMNEQAFQMKIGTDGEGTRVKTNNRSGQIQINLMQSSPSNDDLSSIALADQLANLGVRPFFMKDNTGTTVAAAATAWIQKLPDTEFSNEATGRQWILETDSLELLVGSNNVAVVGT